MDLTFRKVIGSGRWPCDWTDGRFRFDEDVWFALVGQQWWSPAWLSSPAASTWRSGWGAAGARPQRQQEKSSPQRAHCRTTIPACSAPVCCSCLWGLFPCLGWGTKGPQQNQIGWNRPSCSAAIAGSTEKNKVKNLIEETILGGLAQTLGLTESFTSAEDSSRKSTGRTTARPLWEKT